MSDRSGPKAVLKHLGCKLKTSPDLLIETSHRPLGHCILSKVPTRLFKPGFEAIPVTSTCEPAASPAQGLMRQSSRRHSTLPRNCTSEQPPAICFKSSTI